MIRALLLSVCLGAAVSCGGAIDSAKPAFATAKESSMVGDYDWVKAQLATGAHCRQHAWLTGQWIKQDLTAIPTVRYVRGDMGWVPTFLNGRAYTLVNDGTTTWEIAP